MEGWEARAQTRANLEAYFKRQDECGDDAWRAQRDAKLQAECDAELQAYVASELHKADTAAAFKPPTIISRVEPEPEVIGISDDEDDAPPPRQFVNCTQLNQWRRTKDGTWYNGGGSS
jgi:hypothetical protein